MCALSVSRHVDHAAAVANPHLHVVEGALLAVGAQLVVLLQHLLAGTLKLGL